MTSQSTLKNPPFTISPPLINSSNPWATTYGDLKELYDCPYTGAVTIRTSLWRAFTQHPSTHQYTFFSSSKGQAIAKIDTTLAEGRSEVLDGDTSSLNTLGYSPISFEEYVSILVRMSQSSELKSSKPFIVSVTGSAREVGSCTSHLLQVLNEPDRMYPYSTGEGSKNLNMMMEINLSCPNIPDKSPPAYDGQSLSEYISAIEQVKREAPDHYDLGLHIGIKTPPYTYHDQFATLISSLENSTSLPGGCPISFITATNTLGSCLVLDSSNHPALGSVNGTGIGGMAGDALHPIALGNVFTIRKMLDSSSQPSIQQIAVIGIGGVRDSAGYKRMRGVGAAVVGVGTALGRQGVSIFGQIAGGLCEEDLLQ
jgi:dihydroorotate dehydrogenase (fumarate)